MWRRGGRSAALDRAQALLASRGNDRGDGESAQRFPPEDTWQQTNFRSGPSNTILSSDVSDLSSVSSASDHGAAGNIQGRSAGSPKHRRPQRSLAGGLGDGGGVTGGSRFLKKKALAPDALSSKSSQFVSKSQLEQQQLPPPHLRGSQTAALSRLADLESRICGRKPAGQMLKPASDLMPSTALSSPAPAAQPRGPSAAAAAAQPLGLSSPSSDEQSLKGKRFLKSNRASGVKASQHVGPGVSMGPRPVAADGAQPSASTEMRQLTGVSLESDEEDMKKLIEDSLDSANSYFTRARPKSSKRAYEAYEDMESRHGRSVSTTAQPPAAIPLSPSSSPSVPTPRSPASPFRFKGHTQAHFSSSASSPPLSSPRASPSPAPQRPLSSKSSNSIILSLAELFPVGSQEPCSDTSLAPADDFKINVLTLDDLVPVKIDSTEETSEKQQGEQTSASWSRAIQQHHQQQLRHDDKKGEAPDYESDFESESGRTEVKEVRLSERRLGQDDKEEAAEPVSEVMEEVSNASCGSEEAVYSYTFSDVSSCYTSRSPDQSGGRSSWASNSQDGRLERRDLARKVFKDAVVQTQLALPTYSWTAGMSPARGKAFPDLAPLLTHLSAEMVEAIGSFNPSAFVLTELLKQQLATTKRFIENNRQLQQNLLRSMEPPNYRYTTLEDTQELIRMQRVTVRGLDA